MFELFEKTFLAGIGAMSLSQKKADELLGEMKEQLNLSEEEGKKFLNKLESMAKENQKKLEKAADDEIKKSCERLGIVTKEDLAALKGRITKIENKLKELD